MARLLSRFASTAALLAALSMTVTPASAAVLPHSSAASPHYGSGQAGGIGLEAAHHSDYRHYRRHRGGIDTGDLIAGVLVIGGIAAIASAASRNRREADDRDYRGPDYRTPDSRDRPYDYRGDRDGGEHYADGRGIDRAVEICIREVERDEQVGGIESVDRTADGWRVEGDLRDGHAFTCEIGNDGRIRDVDLEADVAGNDRQWNDDDYARARGRNEGGGDGRYRTAEIGDFGGGF